MGFAESKSRETLSYFDAPSWRGGIAACKDR